MSAGMFRESPTQASATEEDQTCSRTTLWVRRAAMRLAHIIAVRLAPRVIGTLRGQPQTQVSWTTCQTPTPIATQTHIETRSDRTRQLEQPKTWRGNSITHSSTRCRQHHRITRWDATQQSSQLNHLTRPTLCHQTWEIWRDQQEQARQEDLLYRPVADQWTPRSTEEEVEWLLIWFAFNYFTWDILFWLLLLFIFET